MMGLRPAHAAREIASRVDGLGANCGRDPAEYPDFVRIMRAEAPDAILWAKPNAGLPHLDGDQVIYDADPAYMADIAVQLHEAGAQVIGGCCGSGPAHIRAMAQALK
jgi:5-methyltetrahydrofolate--homocysteine methyltransferase